MNYNKRSGKLAPSGTSFGITTGCAHCARRIGNFASGSSRGHNNEPLCHPNGPNRPDCYKLVTLYKHSTPCDRTKCYEDHPNFMDYVDDNNTKVAF